MIQSSFPDWIIKNPLCDLSPHQNQVFVLPDFLANARGVTDSYFEQIQSTYNFLSKGGTR